MNKRAFFPVFILAATLLSGCTSTIHVAGKKSELQLFDGGMPPVYVNNPEMTPEYQVLKSSGIYEISSEAEGARRLTLHQMRHLPRCGNPLIGSMFTLGIIPAVLPAPCVFGYELETNGSIEVVEHRLPLYERFSIWEWPLKWNQKRVYARALAVSVPERPPNESLHSTPR